MYTPIRVSKTRFIPLRGWQMHLREWGTLDAAKPPLVMLHGFMDVSASFQFVVDALRTPRYVLSLDWRGFGLSTSLTGAPDAYWFPDYLGDLDALLDALFGAREIDLLGHSMGGNIATIYAGVRPARVRRLINLEGFGFASPPPTQAPDRYAKWLDQLKEPKRLKSYASLDAVAARMRESNPRLNLSYSQWLAGHWARQEIDGRWHLLSDPAHKRINPVLYRDEEAAACRKRITAPTLWVEGAQSDLIDIYGGPGARAQSEMRRADLAQLQSERIEECGHMIHHDQPHRLAALVEDFLSAD
jgi:pimeloyl-ACP methyl ester carboxylesterase